VESAHGKSMSEVAAGLTDMVSVRTIDAFLRSSLYANDPCQEIMILALRLDGEEDVTFVLAPNRFVSDP
jgi:hypothetical protein